MLEESDYYASPLYVAEMTMWERLAKFVISSGYPVKNLKFLRKVGPPAHMSSEPPRGCEVFVNRIPQAVLEDDLYWLFQCAGVIYDIRFMVRPSGLASRGFAFIRYTTPEEAKNAIALLDRKEMFGQPIGVKKSAENNRLFVHGVPLDKTKVEIWDELVRNGMDAIADVIVYKSYYRRARNRGFAFVEFNTHEEAATARRRYNKDEQLFLWDLPVHCDWSKPMVEVDPDIMKNVTRVFVRNLGVGMTKLEFINKLRRIVDLDNVVKVYKKKNYSFVHFNTREAAEEGLERLQHYYRKSDVEVTWSIPPSEAKKKTYQTPHCRDIPPRFNTPPRENVSPLRRRFYGTVAQQHSPPNYALLRRRSCGTDAQQHSPLNYNREANSENRVEAADQRNTKSEEVPSFALWMEENQHWFDEDEKEDANNNIPANNFADDMNMQWFYDWGHLKNLEDLPTAEGTVSYEAACTPVTSVSEADDLDFMPSSDWLEKYVADLLN